MVIERPSQGMIFTNLLNLTICSMSDTGRDTQMEVHPKPWEIGTCRGMMTEEGDNRTFGSQVLWGMRKVNEMNMKQYLH